MNRRCAVLSLALLAGGCMTAPPEPTALQIQSIQTREFETATAVAFGAVVSVFQDLGYIVQSADRETGFITAVSPSSKMTPLWETLSGVAVSSHTKATAFIEEARPGFVSVRLNFVGATRMSSKEGQTSDVDTPVLEARMYQAAFERVENAIFVRSSTRP